LPGIEIVASLEGSYSITVQIYNIMFLTLTTNLYLILLINELKFIGNCAWKNRVYIYFLLILFLYTCMTAKTICGSYYGMGIIVE
jgi:hypothetical protein